MDVATVDDSRKAILKDIFWQMNEISSRMDTSTETVVEESDGGNGNIVKTTTTVTGTTLYITVSHKTAREIADYFNFNADQRVQLAELLADENNSLWAAVLYGIGVSDDAIVAVALSQVGNIGGEPYWLWYSRLLNKMPSFRAASHYIRISFVFVPFYFANYFRCLYAV